MIINIWLYFTSIYYTKEIKSKIYEANICLWL